MSKALLLLALVASPALAEGFNLTQLVQYDFKLKAAVALPGRGAGSATEVLYLQGKLPGVTKSSW